MVRGIQVFFVFCCAWCSVILCAGWEPPPPHTLTDTGTNVISQVIMDANGNAFAVWQNENGSSYAIQAAYKAAGATEWDAPKNVATSTELLSSPKIAVDANGNAIVVWLSRSGSVYTIQSAYKAFSSTDWDAPKDVVTDVLNDSYPQIAMDAGGDAIVVWYNMLSDYSIQVAYKAAGVADWDIPKTISTVRSYDPMIVMDSLGNATVVWTGQNWPQVFIQSAYKPNNASDWNAPEDISDLAQTHRSPQIAIDSNGNIIAVSEGDTVQAAYRSAATGIWDSPKDIALGGSDISGTRVAMGGNGDSIIVWQFFNGSYASIKAVFKAAGSSDWSFPQEISPENSFYPQIAMDGDGNAIAVWHYESDGQYVIQARYKSIGSSDWDTLVALSESGVLVNYPMISMDIRGNATAVWDMVGDPPTMIQARGYFVPVPVPVIPQKPHHFKGKIYKLHHGRHHKYYKLCAHWSKSKTPEVAYYNVYRNHKLWKVVGADQKRCCTALQYTHKLRKKYKVAAVLSGGQESKKTKLHAKKAHHSISSSCSCKAGS